MRSWFRPERNWKGRRTLVPVGTCYRILGLFLWLTSGVGIFGLGMVFFRGEQVLRTDPLFWVICSVQVPLLAAAIFRGWPFTVRYAILVAGMSLYTTSISAEVGLTPNATLLIIIPVAATSLFFGIRAGLALIGALVAAQVLIAWGWVTGRLPAFLPPAATRPFFDYTSAVVWIRVLLIGAGLQAGLVLVMRYILSDLNEALKQANRVLQKLAEEQEYRARAEEARLKAELGAREAQKFEALGRLASGVAHDFNNALCVMKCWSSYLLEEDHGPLVQEAMGEIKRATENAGHLTHHLLAFSSSDPVKREVVDLTELLQIESRTLRRLLPADVEVTVRAGDAAYVRLSHAQLQEIILNLALNARDAMPLGGKLSFSTTLEDLTEVPEGRTAGRYVRFEVADTGTGMDEATSAHIFEPFFTTKGADKGTGLGLAMVYGLVSGAGGWIEVASAVGQGTRFIFRLPAADASELNTEPPVTSVHSLTRCRVLVADDQPEIGPLVERILVREGFPVLAVSSAGDALAALAGNAGRFGLVVVDGVMPGGSTSDIIQQALAGNPDCRVIVISAHLPDQLLQRGIETGCYHYLPKPFSTDQLRNVVNEALSAPPPAQLQPVD